MLKPLGFGLGNDSPIPQLLKLLTIQDSAPDSAGAIGDVIEDTNAALPTDAAIRSNLCETTTRVLASLTPRGERVAHACVSASA